VAAWICGRSLARMLVRISPGGMDVCLLWLLCAVRKGALRRADLLNRAVLSSVVCPSVMVKYLYKMLKIVLRNAPLCPL